MDRFAALVSTDLPLPAAPLLRQRAVQISWLQWKKRTHWRFTWTLTLLWSYYTSSESECDIIMVLLYILNMGLRVTFDIIMVL